MVSESARKEAGKVVGFARQSEVKNPDDRSRHFLKAVDAIVTEAVEQEGAAREIVVTAGKVFSQRDLRNETVKAFRENYIGPPVEVEGENEEETLIFGTAYVAASEILNDQKKRSNVMDVFQSPGKYEDEIVEEIESVDNDFRDALLLEAGKERARSAQFRKNLNVSLKEIQKQKKKLREIGTRGEGEEQGWVISAVLVCPLALWWCVALLVAFIIIFVWIWVS